MDDVITHIVKLLSNTIMVHVYSYPHFSIEIFLACVLCVVHYLLIYEVNSLYKRTNAKAAARLRNRSTPLKEVESCSYHTISQLRTQIFPQKIETTATRQSYYAPIQSYKRLSRKFSTSSNFGWVISHGTSSMIRHSFNDRVEQLLSITPSEYVRKDKERKSREEGLRSCIQSLTSLLEKALNNDGNTLDLEHISKEAIKQSINAIRENFESHMTRDDYQLADGGDNSLQNLIEHSATERGLRNALSPHLLEVRSTESYENVPDQIGDHESEKKDSETDLRNLKSTDLFTDLFSDETVEILHSEQMIPLCNA